MFNGEFIIYYDDQPDDVIDSISRALSEFGLTIKIIDEGDGFVKYQIIQCTSEEE